MISLIFLAGSITNSERAVAIGDDRKPYLHVLREVDVLDPLLVRFHGIDRERDHLDVALAELLLERGGRAEPRRAHRRKIGRLRKQHAPAAAQPFVEANASEAGFLFEIRSGITKTQAGHGRSSQWSATVARG